MNLDAEALSAHWLRLSDPWRSAFSLAWEAFQAGSYPVGAVVCDPAGMVVSTGRNRIRETVAPPGELAGTNLAHAEMNALATLPAGSYGDHVLLTTLEPCLLCSAALRHCHIGTVEYAAPDPTWLGIERVVERNGHVARGWTTRVGPLDGPIGAWAALLPMLVYAQWPGAAVVAESYRAGFPPELGRLADRLAAPAQLARLRGSALPDAFEMLGTLAGRMKR